MADIATARFIGRTTALTGVPESLTTAQATALLDAATATVKGLVPTPPNNTTTFLRGDATFAAPSGGGADIRVRVFNSATISIANSSWTLLTFNSERWDTDTMHSTVTNTGRLVATTAGLYVITGHVQFAANATGQRIIRILVNGVTMIALQGSPANPVAVYMTVATTYNLAATDYVTLEAFQESGAALNVTVEGNDSPEFSMVKVLG
jgi:hypothetical protein